MGASYVSKCRWETARGTFCIPLSLIRKEKSCLGIDEGLQGFDLGFGAHRCTCSA